MTKTFFISCAMVLSCALAAAAETPYVTVWSRGIGTSETERAVSMHVDNWGNVYITGTTNGEFDKEKSHGGTDLFLALVDDEGNIEWIRQFGSVADDNITDAWYSNMHERTMTVKGEGVVIREDDNLNVLKKTYDTGLTVDKNGVMHTSSESVSAIFSHDEWMKSEDSSAIEADVVNDTRVIHDYVYEAGSIVGGDCDNSYTMNGFLRYQYNHTPIRFFCTPGRDECKILENLSETPLVGGVTEGNLDGRNNHGDKDVFLYSPQFETILIGSEADDDITSVYVSLDGGIYVLGETHGGIGEYVNKGDTDVFLTKVDRYGRIKWERQFGSNRNDTAVALAEGNDGSIYVLCNSEAGLEGSSDNGAGDAVLIKLAPDRRRHKFVDMGGPSQVRYDKYSTVKLDKNDIATVQTVNVGDLICVRVEKKIGEPPLTVLKGDPAVLRLVATPKDEIRPDKENVYLVADNPGNTVLVIGTEFYELFSCKMIVEEYIPDEEDSPETVTTEVKPPTDEGISKGL